MYKRCDGANSPSNRAPPRQPPAHGNARHANNPGGISYLDIADAYMRGDLGNAINGYWSPLYSLLLGPALVVFRPGPYYEASVAHLVNFLIYCAAMVTFDGFSRP